MTITYINSLNKTKNESSIQTEVNEKRKFAEESDIYIVPKHLPIKYLLVTKRKK